MYEQLIQKAFLEWTWLYALNDTFGVFLPLIGVDVVFGGIKDTSLATLYRWLPRGHSPELVKR